MFLTQSKMTIPTYTDSRVEHYRSAYLQKGYPSQQAERWAKEQACLDWMEQVTLLSDTSTEKCRLMDLATEEMKNEKKLSSTNLKWHTAFVKRWKRNYQSSDEEEPVHFTESRCWKMTYIGLLIANIIIRLLLIILIIMK